MKTSRSLLALPLVGALALAACDSGQPTEPLTDTTTLTQSDEIALSVITDDGAIQAALALADAPLAVAGRMGMAHGMRGTAEDDALQARLRFREANEALVQQNRLRAATRAQEARRLVAGVVMAAGGGPAIASLVDRAGTLASTVAQDPAGYDDAVGLQGELTMLAERARERIRLGDSIGAGDCAVLAEQRYRQRQRESALRPGGAVVAVQLGATAVELAGGTLDQQDATDEQLRLLAQADEYQQEAEATLAAGDTAGAVHLAELATWTALAAVVLPDGVTDEEAQAILELAQTRYEAALATNPEGVEATLLERAQILLEAGSAALQEATPRGLCALWRSAVISTWIVG
jgi:hypothetical protein